MAREYMAARVQWKAAADDSNTLEGYASVFGNTDLHFDIVKRGAFKKTIRERVKGGKVRLLNSHIPDADHVIGTVVDAKEDSHGLFIKAKLSAALSVQDIKTKLIEGHLEYLSIGYEPVKQSWHRDGEDEMIRHLEELKLYEVSVVPFPANEEAAISTVKEAFRAIKSGMVEIPAEDRKDIAEELSDALGDALEQPVTLVVGRTPDQVKSMLVHPSMSAGTSTTSNALSVTVDGDWTISTGDKGPIEKGAISSHSTGTSGDTWSASENEGRISNDADASTLRRMYAWIDPDKDSDTKDAYKFPHHNVSTTGAVGAANLAGCSAGIAVLNGGRGGANIPSDDRQGVYNHLAKHLRDGDREPPELSEKGEGDEKQDLSPPEQPVHWLDEIKPEPLTGESQEERISKWMERARMMAEGRDPDEAAEPNAHATLTAQIQVEEHRYSQLLEELKEQESEAAKKAQEMLQEFDKKEGADE